MKKGTFYQLTQASPLPDLEAHEWLACELAAQLWRNGKRVLIACETQQQAEKIDETLWQRDPHQFVPHNLAGESLVMVRLLKFVGMPNGEIRHVIY